MASESATVEVTPGGPLELTLKTQAIAIRSLSIDIGKTDGTVKIDVARLSGKLSGLDAVTDTDVYQYLQIDHENLDDGDISSVTIDFSVGADWIESRGHDQERIVLQRYTGRWASLPTSVAGRDSDSVHYTAVSPSLSLFAITVDDQGGPSTESPASSPTAIIPTATPSVTPAAPEPTISPTATPAPSVTPIPSATPHPTSTAIPVSTSTPFPTSSPAPTTRPPSTATPTRTPSPTPTTAIATPLASASPSATATQTATPTSTPSPPATATPIPTPTRTATPQGGGTIIPPAPTATPTFTPTPVPTTTPAPTATPTPTITPAPLAADDRYGVVLHTSSRFENEYFLDQLGLEWYLNFGHAMSQAPEGASKLPFIQVPQDPDVWNSGQAESIESLSDAQIADLGFMTRTEIRQMAQDSPGSYWYVFGEANRYGYMTGARFAPVFHYFVTQIKLGDPTARIVGTSILNWDFTCIGCAGYQSGEAWLNDFIDAYSAPSMYGEVPQVDAWAIDVYPIDWNNTPNNDPGKLAFYAAKGGEFPHWSIAVQQLQGMRAFLDTIPEYASTPIWITEIAIHVGYDSWGWDPYPTNMTPIGNFNWDKMGDYLISVLDWLEANAASKKIERWFFFSSWKDIVNIGPDGYMGITFFDGRDVGASLNCLGEAYRARALGEPPLRCDANGNTVPQ